MANLKPLKLYHTGPSPNPWKVAVILEELNLPYDLIKVDDVKGEEFLQINPNGRVPALVDPNTNVTTWESGSNIDYLIETYDKDNKISYASSPEKFLARNWAHFQMSGQGPYYGQRAWFTRFHPEKIQSAIDRYGKEIDRVISVIELHLSRTGQKYLVGDEATYADLMFLAWNNMLSWFQLEDFDWKTKYPKSFEWHERLNERESVKKIEEVRGEFVKAMMNK